MLQQGQMSAHYEGPRRAPETYEEWKAAKGADVRASRWVGWFLGNMLVAFIWSYPLYLVGVLFAERLTLLPDTRVEWVVWGGLAFLLFLLARGKGRPNHLEPDHPGRPRRLSDSALRAAVARGDDS